MTMNRRQFVEASAAAAVLTAGEAGVGAAMCVAFVTVPVCALFVMFVWKAAGDVGEDERRVRLDIHGRRVESARGRGRYGRARGSMVGAQAGDLSLSPEAAALARSPQCFE